MKVCIAEKPSVAREIALVLGAKARKEGYFEGNGYQVTWTFGHFCTLREPDDYKPEWKRWSMYDLPMLPEKYGIKLMKDSGVQKQFGIIKKLLENAEEVINCGDAGQEGEVIQRWVLTEANYRKPFKRLWISSLTEDAIRQGFAKLKDGSEFDLLYQAGKSRAIGDWLLGLNATRLFTLKYANGRQTLSIGRVQTPTLAMLVNRHHEIANFVPQPFWELKTVYRDTTFSSTNGRFQKEEEAQKIMDAIREAELTITDVETKKGTESPPKLFDLTSLQIECNNKLSLSADETLKTVQSLYEKKVVSYPRVDTTFLPDDIYPKIPDILQGLNQYRQEVAPLLESKIRKTKKVFNNNKVTDHHAIIPTGADAGSLYGREADVYDIITRRFLAALYPDCIVSNTTVMAESAGYDFRVRGKQILEPGWRVLYGAEDIKTEPTTKDGKEEDEATGVLPHFDKGEHGPHAPLLEKKMTNPPKEYTEATLLRAMETAGRQVEDEELKDALKENGIGRPSTRAAIIETLFKRQYIRKDKKKIIPTQMGIDLIGVIRNQTLKSAEMTGQWERKLRQIEGGEFKAETFLQELQEFVMSLVQEVKYDHAATVTMEPQPDEAKPAQKPAKAAKKNSAAAPPTQGLGSCPACKEGHILKGSKAYGCIRYKEGCRFLLPIEQQGKEITDKQVQALLSKGKTPTIKGFKDAQGESYDAILTLDANKQLVVEKVEKVEKTAEKDPFAQCPRCKQGKLLKGNSAYGCSRFREGCKFLVPFEMGGKQLSEKQIAALVLKGKTPKIKGFISQKTGEPFDAALILNEQWQVVYQF
ncbi:type IA DNA topoisomerase [Pontibacter akesuensis]|uniref:DNA topoisomerase n=1 Tax=Pontibacter akesuensis TaxID=388950 RepID=A0A1I7KGS1_9BACT|nr:type IA DNA topoisomerase [Pontibacter akesuensis]GHA79189.1 DNA topoisomerase III [Pontibacter akesuensis]SFU96612.1 DNA topoisomerase-3 [Pontibacter akesuensis]